MKFVLYTCIFIVAFVLAASRFIAVSLSTCHGYNDCVKVFAGTK